MYCAGKQTLEYVRGVPTNDFNIQNMGGDLLLLGIHFFFGLFMLALIEGYILKAFQKCCSGSGKIKPKKSIELDEDVIEEEKRVEQYMHEFK